MSVHIRQDEAHALRATVSGDFDFETSRQLLLGIRKRWDGEGQAVDITLSGGTRATSCAIGALILVAEFAGRNVHLRLERCQGEVHNLFGGGLLDRFFPPELLAGCRSCHGGRAAGCSSS